MTISAFLRLSCKGELASSGYPGITRNHAVVAKDVDDADADYTLHCGFRFGLCRVYYSNDELRNCAQNHADGKEDSAATNSSDNHCIENAKSVGCNISKCLGKAS